MTCISIKDPTNGQAARVTPSGRILTSGADMTLLGQCSLDNAEGYLIHGTWTLQPGVATGVHWFKNTSPDKQLLIQRTVWGSDGSLLDGGNGVFDCDFFLADPNTPPSGAVSGAFEYMPKRMNLGNPTPPDVQAFGWDDAVAGGLTGVAYNPAWRVFQGIVGRGQSSLELACSLIIPPNGPAAYHVFTNRATNPMAVAVTFFACHLDNKDYTQSL